MAFGNQTNSIMPENSVQNQEFYPRPRVISISKNAEKREPIKYNKPYCMIPDEDLSWVLTQAKSIQNLWNECWQADRFGSRFVKLTTTLKTSAFRLARRVLSAAGLFQFKRDTSCSDSRKTESWSVINLHGARRIKEYWNSESIAATDLTISATNSPTTATDLTISATDLTIAATNSPDISTETIVKPGVSEPLNNSSKSFHELLKEVHVEEIVKEPELEKQVPALSPTFEEETTAKIIELRSCGTKEAERKARLYEYALKKHKEPERNMNFRESLITTYNWEIDEKRLEQLQNLTEECKRSFFERFEKYINCGKYYLPEIFDRIITTVKNSFQTT